MKVKKCDWGANKSVVQPKNFLNRNEKKNFISIQNETPMRKHFKVKLKVEKTILPLSNEKTCFFSCVILCVCIDSFVRFKYAKV